MRRFPPERIVCLTEETVETLYLLARSAGSSASPATRSVRSAFASRSRGFGLHLRRHPEDLALEPDLVLTFSDLQEEIAQALLREGVTVFGFNQRDVAGILAMIRALGTLVGAEARAERLARGYEERLARVRAASAGRPRRRVYFEEWDEPMISGIGWVSELIEIAGGRDVFAELASQKAAKDRIVQAEDVVRAAPDVILASWCGEKVRSERIAGRPGWSAIPAVAAGAIHEIKSPLILQPGPAALTDGLDAIVGALA
jgi:iron complex transport system substrate-binding protein